MFFLLWGSFLAIENFKINSIFSFFFFGDISPIKKADVSGSEQTQICVSLYTLWVWHLNISTFVDYLSPIIDAM
jgi:hypothetical protein